MEKPQTNPIQTALLPNKFPDLWEKVEKLFKTEIKSIQDLNNVFYYGKSNFFKKIEQSYQEDGAKLIKVFNNISKLVLSLKNIFPNDEFEILKSKTTDKVILKRRDVALIFILGFFDIFAIDIEKTNIQIRYTFFEILNSTDGPCFNKGRCFLNYMTVIGNWLEEDNPKLNEMVTYIRENIKINQQNFDNIKKLCDVEIVPQGSMFDTKASFCVDFANKYIGGGTLSGGCVQEEILFAVEPEAIVSIFFMEKMENNDAIRIDNLIQYSKYSGYATSFKYEESEINDKELIKHNIIAIDAVCTYLGGVNKDDVLRDFIKAYAGFNLINFNDKDVSKLEKTIATGNWGCGAFGGDYELKFIQQLLAATYAGVDKLYYYTFGRKEMDNVVANLEKLKSLNARDLYERMIEADLLKGKVLDIILNTDIKKSKKGKNGKKKNVCNIY